MPDPDDFQDPLENYEPKTYDDPLEQALADETVVAIRHEPFVTISPDMLVQEAVEKLAGLHVACLLVAEDNKLVGIFSDRDVLDKVTLEYDEVKDRPVRDVMTDSPIYVHEGDSAAAALSVMAVSGYRHVPVLATGGDLVGIISPQRVTAFLQQHFADD
jgi:CBS domain-containing protein